MRQSNEGGKTEKMDGSWWMMMNWIWGGKFANDFTIE